LVWSVSSTLPFGLLGADAFSTTATVDDDMDEAEEMAEYAKSPTMIKSTIRDHVGHTTSGDVEIVVNLFKEKSDGIDSKRHCSSSHEGDTRGLARR
jgi:hypothetical protein